MIDSIHISLEQQTIIDNMRNELAREIENKKDGQKIYRFNGVSIISPDIWIQFIDSVPSTIYFNNCLIGSCVTSKTTTDKLYEIGKIKQFNEFNDKTKNFILTVGYTYDGCLGGYYSKAYDPDMKRVIDFTDYN
jgi:hypothetical protein